MDQLDSEGDRGSSTFTHESDEEMLEFESDNTDDMEDDDYDDTAADNIEKLAGKRTIKETGNHTAAAWI